MHLISTLILCLLASGGSAQTYINSKNPTSKTASILQSKADYEIIYEYRMIPLNANFTIFDDFDHGALAIGTGPAGEVIEVKPNEGQQWSIQQLTESTHVVRDKNSAKFIHFPELKDGAVATVSEDAATLFEAVIAPNVIYNLNATDANPSDGPLMWTVEAYSAMDPRPVLKLRKPASGRARQDFIMKKTPLHVKS